MSEEARQSAESARHLLDVQRERAERLLNGVRAGVLGLLAAAALVYAPSLTPTLNRVNVLVLAPTLAWTIGQYLIFYRRERLPEWLSIANPLVDITAVSAIMLGDALAQSAALALQTPIFLSYFVILAPRRECEGAAARAGRRGGDVRDGVARAAGAELFPPGARPRTARGTAGARAAADAQAAAAAALSLQHAERDHRAHQRAAAS